MQKRFGTTALGHCFLQPEAHLFGQALHPCRRIFFFYRLHLAQQLNRPPHPDRQNLPEGSGLYTKKAAQEHQR